MNTVQKAKISLENSFENWDKESDGFSSMSDYEDDDLYDQMFHELTNEELHELSQKRIKYVEPQNNIICRAPLPLTINNSSISYKLESLGKTINEDIIVKQEIKDATIKPFLKWASPIEENKSDTSQTEEMDNNSTDSDSDSDSDSDEEDFYKWGSKNKVNVQDKKPVKQEVVVRRTRTRTPTPTPIPLIMEKDNREKDTTWTTVSNKKRDVIPKPPVNNLRKTKVCKIKNCTKGKNCSYAHSFEELNVKPCLFNDKCQNIKKNNDTFYNLEGKPICNFIHENETTSNFKFRLGFSKTLEIESSPKKSLERSEVFDILGDKTKIQKELKFTKFCKFLKDKQECPHKNSCSFAHSIEQLRVSKCLFNDKCRLVTLKNNKLINVSKTNMCDHLHDKETLENYYSRIGLQQYNTEKKMEIKKIFL
jgi:hypothetical protein